MSELSIKDIGYHSTYLFLPNYLRDRLDVDLIGSNKYTFYISGWSILHFIGGCLIGFLFLYFKWDNFYFLKLLILHILFEAWELFVQTSQPYNLTGDGNLVDTIIDTILFMLGGYIVYGCYR